MDAITEWVSEEIDDDLSVHGERDLLNALTKTTIMMIMIRISLTILAMQFFCLLQNMLLSLCVYGTKISKYKKYFSFHWMLRMSCHFVIICQVIIYIRSNEQTTKFAIETYIASYIKSKIIMIFECIVAFMPLFVGVVEPGGGWYSRFHWPGGLFWLQVDYFPCSQKSESIKNIPQRKYRRNKIRRNR